MTRERLYPRGGSRMKNWVAKTMVAHGNRQVDADAEFAKINSRILPAAATGDSHENDLYNDSFVFQGAAANGDFFMSRLGFRGNGVLESWVFLEINNKIYVNETTEFHSDDDGCSISAGGLTYSYDAGVDQWEVAYDGALKGPDGTVPVEVDLQYVPSSEMYLSSVHMDAASTGKAMAEMPWSRQYFEKLRTERQVRIEQGALLAGRVKIDGVRRDVSLRGFRDHSWGKRDWSFINRYIWNIFSLNSPIRIENKPFDYICFTTVDYGSSFKHLVSGWIAGPDEIRAIVASSNMHQLASDGVVPDKYQVTFKPQRYAAVQVDVSRSPHNHSWMMHDGDFEVNEAYCRIAVNGVHGQGMSEFGFARHTGIPRPVFAGRK